VSQLKLSQRNVAAFDHTSHDGRGHGRGRRRQDGRGNQGHGRGNGGRERGGWGQNGRGGYVRYVPYTGCYTADEWQSLSASQRTRVNEARSQMSQGQGQATNDTNRRQIGAVDISHIPDDTLAITTPTQATTGLNVQGN